MNWDSSKARKEICTLVLGLSIYARHCYKCLCCGGEQTYSTGCMELLDLVGPK